MFSDYPDVVNIHQLMEMLQVGRTTAYKLIADGTIKSFRLRKNYKIPKVNIINYIMEEV